MQGGLARVREDVRRVGLEVRRTPAGLLSSGQPGGYCANAIMLGAAGSNATVNSAAWSIDPLRVGSTVNVTGSQACGCDVQIVWTSPAGAPPCMVCDCTKT
jgi:hypothetical protein